MDFDGKVLELVMDIWLSHSFSWLHRVFASMVGFGVKGGFPEYFCSW